MQELNHHPKGEIETGSSYLNATSKSCQLANPPTPRNPQASAELYEFHSPAYYTQNERGRGGREGAGRGGKERGGREGGRMQGREEREGEGREGGRMQGREGEGGRAQTGEGGREGAGRGGKGGEGGRAEGGERGKRGRDRGNGRRRQKGGGGVSGRHGLHLCSEEGVGNGIQDKGLTNDEHGRN